MTLDRDALAVLGLSPGATREEVKRAYRRLAKAFHPDAAGPAAMPRFLAIQAAYERLIGGGPATPSESPKSPEPGRAGATRESWRRRGYRRPTGAPGSAASGGSGASGASGASAGAGPGPAAAGRPPTAGRGRAKRRATPGSTSYDEAVQEPLDPDWSGASWYGQSSGTYWTMNPREYADPRKHGPEYQARARRSSPGSDGPDAADGPDAGDGRDAADGGFHGPPPPPRTSADAAPRSWAFGDSGGAGRRTEPRGPARPGWAADRDRGMPGDPGRPPGSGPVDPGSVVARAAAGLPFPVLGSRAAIALAGWPPLGLGIAWLIGEASGCGRFSAACTTDATALGLGTWLVQLAIVALLFLVPAAGAASALGTVGMLVAAIPAAAVLSIGGGGYAPAAAAAALGVFLVAGYVMGVIYALVRRSRTIRP